DLVAALRHDRRFLDRPKRREAEPQKRDAHRAGDIAQLRQVRAGLSAGLMQVLKRRAGKLELAARLQRDRRHVLLQRDDVLFLVNALPAVLVGQTIEQRANALLALIRDGLQALAVEGKLLVLGADAPSRAIRLIAGLK